MGLVLYQYGRASESWILWVRFPKSLAHYIAVKGSITIAGVSLTVNEIEGSSFRCNIIPHTIKETLFHTLQSGDEVNLEVDVLPDTSNVCYQFQQFMVIAGIFCH